jgi:hypothetical protein
MRPSVTVASPARWDRQPGESEAAYRAFCAFRDMGQDRTSIAAFRQQRGNKRATHPSGEWSRMLKAHDWHARALAWDHHNAGVAQDAVDRVTEDQAEKWARRRDQQAEADYAFSQSYAGQIARHFPKGDLPPLPIRELKDAVAVTAAASALAWAAINTQLPDTDPDADFDFENATTEEIRAAIARLEGKFAPRIARRH